MAAKTIEIRAKYNSGITTVNALITHPMESGYRVDSRTGNIVPPHFIQKVTCRYKEAVLLVAQWGIGMPMNPYLSFRFEGGEKGEQITLQWTDNKGNNDIARAVIK